jgi:hypothetical protein
MKWVKNTHINHHNKTDFTDGIKNIVMAFLVLGFGMFIASVAKSACL